jgi:hypothetical protein
VISKKSNKGNLLHKFGNLKISKVLDLLPDTSLELLELQCNGSFVLTGEDEEHILSPAILALTLVKSNRVVGLNVFLQKVNTAAGIANEIDPLRSSMTVDDTLDQAQAEKKQFAIPIDQEFAIAIDVSTEDGAGFQPDSEALELTLKYRNFDIPNNDIEEPFLPSGYNFHGRVDSSDLFTRIELEAGVQRNNLYFRHDIPAVGDKGSAQFLKIGLYELCVSYVEKREGAQFLSKGKKKVPSFGYIFYH